MVKIRNILHKINERIFKKIKKESNAHNKVAQKLLSIGVSASLMLAMVPNNGAFAKEPTTFVTSANSNHWGRSDLRAYLNNVTKSDNTLPIDSTVSGTIDANYPSQFSGAEYGLVQPFMYSTNVLDDSKNATAVYETTDKFWLPSGNVSNDLIISWGAEDISSSSQYSQTTENNKQRIIPISYWSYGASIYSRLRSPYYSGNSGGLNACRGSYVISEGVNYNSASVAAFKIKLESVIFASAASAADIITGGGAKKIEIDGTSKEGGDYAAFGEKSKKKLPDYGMYLKTSSSSSFSPTGLSLSGTNLTVNYSGGVANQYVVVHAFKEDSLTGGHTSYVAAQELVESSTSATIDVSAWGLSSLDGYTIKVWMEDGSGSLAKATTPVTFVGTTKTEVGASTNARVFAMKADLQTSWGTLKNATDLVGENPTNQKIYFGFGEKDGKPLEFWIAGRETAANAGSISANGNIMTLYQAKSLEQKSFNDSASNYDVSDKSAVTLQLQDNQSGASYPESKITFTQNSVDLEKSLLKWQHRTPGTTAWTDDIPTNPGSFEIRCYAEGTENYERTYSAIVNFKVIGTPSASDFTFTAPSNLTYDGTAKTANITSNKYGMGTITVKYYDSDGSQLDSAPIKTGTYTVKIDVAEGDSYYSANDLTDDSWKFTIAQKEITPQITAENKDYDGNSEATVSVEFDGLVAGETLEKDVDYTIDSATFDNANAGENKTVTVIFTSLNNTPKANNYTLSSDQATTAANIDKKSITVTADAQTKIEGEVDPELTYTVDGLIEGDRLTGNLVREEGEKPGTYDIKLGTLENPNYKITFIPGTFTIAETPSYSGGNDETEQPSDHPEWGETMINIKGIKHYISACGTTSVEISSENTDRNGIIWLKEESDGLNAWYGLDNSSGIFQEGSRFYVQWLNEQEHPEAFENIDEETRAKVENNNGWLFEVGVIRADGTQYTQLEKTVDFYVQIGDDWDEGDLEGFYITLENDESVPVRYGTTAYSEGTDEFGIMSLSHFSPYFIYDKLTDEEKAAFDALSDEEKAQLDASAKELASQQEEKAAEANKTSNNESTKTGDEITYFTVSGLGLIMTLALGFMLNSKINRKKFD